MQHATRADGQAYPTAVAGRELEMPGLVQAQRLDGRADDQAKGVTRTGLGKAISRLADDYLRIGAAAQDRTVEMEFHAVAQEEGNGGDLPADQVGWLVQQRISRSLLSFCYGVTRRDLSFQ